jgi:hypothetical protein
MNEIKGGIVMLPIKQIEGFSNEIEAILQKKKIC